MIPLPPELHTERLTIRRFEDKDFPAFERFMTSEKATRYLLFSKEQKTPAGIRALFDETVAGYQPEMEAVSLAVADRASDVFIGSLGWAPDFDGQNLQVYWSLLPEFWGQGLAAESMRALLDYLQPRLQGRELRAYSHPDNQASLRLARRLGLQDRGLQMVEAIGQEAHVFVFQIEDR